MVSKEGLETFLNKKVFVKLIEENRVQVGLLKFIGDDFFLESKYNRTIIEPSQIARITEEKGGGS